MGVFRLLLLVLGVWLVLRLLRLRVDFRRIENPHAPQTTDPPPYEPMARCAHCGTHMPAATLNRAGLCGRCAG